MTKAERKEVLEKYDGHCAYCGEKKRLQVDHVKSKRCGGSEDVKNLKPACGSCNATKSTYTIEEFRLRLSEDVVRMRRDSAKFRILERFGLVEVIEKKVIFYFEKVG